MLEPKKSAFDVLMRKGQTTNKPQLTTKSRPVLSLTSCEEPDVVVIDDVVSKSSSTSPPSAVSLSSSPPPPPHSSSSALESLRLLYVHVNQHSAGDAEMLRDLTATTSSANGTLSLLRSQIEQQERDHAARIAQIVAAAAVKRNEAVAATILPPHTSCSCAPMSVHHKTTTTATTATNNRTKESTADEPCPAPAAATSLGRE